MTSVSDGHPNRGAEEAAGMQVWSPRHDRKVTGEAPAGRRVRQVRRESGTAEATVVSLRELSHPKQEEKQALIEEKAGYSGESGVQHRDPARGRGTARIIVSSWRQEGEPGSRVCRLYSHQVTFPRAAWGRGVKATSLGVEGKERRLTGIRAKVVSCCGFSS